MEVGMETQKEKCQQILQLTMRKQLEVNGIIDVVRFDDLAVVLQTVCGELTVEGSGLKMSVLDTDKGIVSLDGQVDSIYYSDDIKETKKKLFGRVFN
jgi:sporulation protein YabP